MHFTKSTETSRYPCRRMLSMHDVCDGFDVTAIWEKGAARFFKSNLFSILRTVSWLSAHSMSLPLYTGPERN
jgi:hypothetical protein